MFSILQINARSFLPGLRKISGTIITFLFLSFCLMSCGDEEEPYEGLPGEETLEDPGERDETPVYPKEQSLFIDMMKVVDEI